MLVWYKFQDYVQLCFSMYLHLFHTYSKSEYIIFKLREMRKIAETVIIQISREFDSLEHGNRGKITLAESKC